MRRRARKSADAPGPENLFAGFLRGTDGPPMAAFHRWPTPEQLGSNPELKFDPLAPAGKIFLGVVNGQVRETRLADGRSVRAVSGGDLMGYGDDRHVCSVAGNRAGKGRSLIRLLKG